MSCNPLAFAAEGWPVLPLRHRDSADSKKPSLGNWQNDASKDPEVVKSWLESKRGFNWGGRLDGRIVIDLDCETKEQKLDPDYRIPWPADIAGVEYSDTRIHYSGRLQGGGHVIYNLSADQEARLKALGTHASIKGVSKSIDWKSGSGHYVVLPGSRHPGEPAAGIEGGDYTSNGKPIKQCPDGIFAWVIKNTVEKKIAEPEKSITTTTRTGSKLSCLLADIATLGDGGGRNNKLTAIAGHLRLLFPSDRASYGLLIEAINRAMSEPLPDDEVSATIKQGWKWSPLNDFSNLSSDYDLANSIVPYTNGGVRFSEVLGWMSYEDGTWTPVSTTAVLRTVADFLDAMCQRSSEDMPPLQIAKMRSSMLSSGKAASVERMLRVCAPVDDLQWDKDAHLLNCANGVVDLRTGDLLPHNEDFYMTKNTGCNYVPGKRLDLWDTILSALPPDAKQWFQRKMGQAITGDIPSDLSVLFTVGKGSNGKSSVFGALVGALGTYAGKVPKSVIVGRGASAGASPDVMTLQGLRLALIEELPDKVSPDKIKDLTDAKVVARGLYRGYVTFKASHTLVVTSNHQPGVTDTDDGVWRRNQMIPFPYKYVTPEKMDTSSPVHKLIDPEIERLLISSSGELSEAVVAWCVEGAVMNYSEGGVPECPPVVNESSNTWRADNDTFESFFDDNLMPDPDSAIVCSDVVTYYKDYLEGQGYASVPRTTVYERFEYLVRGRWPSTDTTKVKYAPSVSRHPLRLHIRPNSNGTKWRGFRWITREDHTE